MKPKTMILMVVAIGCGLVASFMTSKLLAERREQAPQAEKIKLLVSKTRVPKNTVLKEPQKFFEERERDASEEPKTKYFTEFSELKDKRLKTDLKANSHVSPEDIQDRNTSSMDVPPGYGLFGLPVTPASLAGGYVFPGDKVDIILTQRPDNGRKISARTILKDVQVIAVGDKAIRPEGEGGAIQANTVAVALLPEDAARLRVAEKLGELSLWLHGSDEASHSAKVITEDDILRGGQATEPKDTKTEEPKDPERVPAVVGVPLPELEALAKKDPKKEPAKEPKKEPKKDPERVPTIVGVPLPELEALAKKDTKTEEPKVEEPKEEVKKPRWTLTIRPGFEPAIVQHYYDHPDGGVVRDESEVGASKKDR